MDTTKSNRNNFDNDKKDTREPEVEETDNNDLGNVENEGPVDINNYVDEVENVIENDRQFMNDVNEGENCLL